MKKSFTVKNSGFRTQAVFVDGLATDVAPGAEVSIENYELTDEMRAHYAVRGVEFLEIDPEKKKRTAKKGTSDSDEDAAKALQAAEEAVAAAEKQLAEATDEAAKALAETALANATAALANLKASA